MSAIGRYVHLTAYNYEQHGIKEVGESISLSEALAAEKKSISDRIKNYEKVNDNTLKSLENKINEMIKRLGTEKSENLSKEEKWGKMARDFLEGELNKEFNKLQNLDWNKISVDMREDAIGVGKIRTSYTTYKRDSWRKVIVDRVNKLNLALRQMEKGINAQSGVDPKEYSLAIDNLSKLLNETYEKTWEAISQTGAKVNKKTTQNLIKEINELIGQYTALPDLPKQRGDMFEHVLQLVPQMAETEIDREMYEKANKGTQKVKVIIDNKPFEKQALKNEYGDITREINSSQNKIDVAFKWKGKQLNISAKNVDFKGEKYNYIHTLEGSSLDYLLQDENPDFVNHYLNLFSLHYGKRAKNINWDAQRKEIMEVMKLLISYKALTGDTFGRKDYKTNVFIINEKSRGVKVISIAKLLKEMQNRHFGNLSISGNVGDLYKNKKVEGPEIQRHVLKWTRVSNVLQEMHSRKISASFNSSLIWQ